MNKKSKTIALAAGFAVLLVGAGVLYNTLAARVEPEAALMELEGGETNRVAAEPPQASASDADRDEEQDDGLAPDFAVYDADGNEVRLSDLRGKPVVVNFWASWCPPCKSEMPDFDEVWAELGGEVHFMMIDLVDGGRETVESGAAYVEEMGFSFPVYYDTTGQAGYLYAVSSIPTTYFIDSEGRAVAGAKGAISEKQLREGIGRILPA